MERLLDKLDKVDKKTTFDPGEECLADLIRASEPVVVSPARKQRLLNRVMLRQQSRRSATARRLLRPVLAIGVLSLAGATAAATIGRRAWIDRHTQADTDTDLSNAARVVVVAPSKRFHSFSRSAIPTVAPVVTPVDEAPPADAEPETALRPGHRPGKGSNKASRNKASQMMTRRPRAASSEDPSRVVDAIQALRTDHDPVRAETLLSEYLARYPHGALTEEAVALSIEAASARHSPGAALFAERYMRDYPNGRFRRAAEQALEQRNR